jgi:hypothetical protein
MEQLRISGKNLGQLALASFCPRCFWLKQKMGNKLPWQIFPGVFANIDSYCKNLVDGYWAAHDRIPRWLDPAENLDRPIPAPGHQQFWVVDEATNIKLTGAADAIFRTIEGEFVILDFKTAKYTPAQDELLPLYETQLNSYAYIAERRGISPVTGLGLVYCEPMTKLTEEQVTAMVKSSGFLMPFNVKGVPLRREPEVIVPPLLRKVREIVDSPVPPAGRDGCKDCERVEALVALLRCK